MLSHATSFSPDAGLRNVGRVVVAVLGKVDAAIDAVSDVLAVESAVFPQATRPTRRGRSKSAFFTIEVCQQELVSKVR